MNGYGKFALGWSGAAVFMAVVLGVNDSTWINLAFGGILGLLAIAQELRR